MPSTREKGTGKENLVKQILEQQHYRTSPRPKKVVWVNGRNFVSDADYFGVFDILCFNEHHWKAIQVTHWENSNQYPRMNKIRDFLEDNPMPPNTIKEVWAWRAGRKKLDKRFTDKKVFIPHQLFYVYTLMIDNQFKETMRIHKSGKILWEL